MKETLGYIYEQGYRDGYKDIADNNNPFNKESPEYQAYEVGYKEGRFDKIYPQGGKGNMAAKIESEESAEELQQKIASVLATVTLLVIWVIEIAVARIFVNILMPSVGFWQVLIIFLAIKTLEKAALFFVQQLKGKL